MCPFHRGKRLKSAVAHLLEQVRHKPWHPVCYGYLIMQYRDAPAARQNFGLADESIIVGKCDYNVKDNAEKCDRFCPPSGNTRFSGQKYQLFAQKYYYFPMCWQNSMFLNSNFTLSVSGHYGHEVSRIFFHIENDFFFYVRKSVQTEQYTCPMAASHH